jgi:CubicO group peptidase (beta-lactamase class C family)
MQYLSKWVTMACLITAGLAIASKVAAGDICKLAKQDDRQTQLAAAYQASTLPGYCGVRFTQKGASCFAGGFAKQTDATYTLDTRQPIGSVSKTFIGLALAQLSVSGEIDLDAPIDRYLPWQVQSPKFPNVAITLRQLATHTSSIRDRSAAYRQSYVAPASASLTLAEYLKSYLVPKGKLYQNRNFIKAMPGMQYEYSNIGAALAAYVIEVKLGMPFDAYVQAKILSPIGMQASFLPKPGDAVLYEKNGEAVPPYRLITYPDGGLTASCSDISRYLQAVLEAKAGRASSLDAKAVQLMLTPQFGAKRPAKLPEKITDHGLFWEQRGEKWGHTGSDPGVTALIAIDPAKGLARMQLTNIDIEESDAITEQFIGLWKLLE